MLNNSFDSAINLTEFRVLKPQPLLLAHLPLQYKYLRDFDSLFQESLCKQIVNFVNIKRLDGVYLSDLFDIEYGETKLGKKRTLSMVNKLRSALQQRHTIVIELSLKTRDREYIEAFTNAADINVVNMYDISDSKAFELFALEHGARIKAARFQPSNFNVRFLEAVIEKLVKLGAKRSKICAKFTLHIRTFLLRTVGDCSPSTSTPFSDHFLHNLQYSESASRHFCRSPVNGSWNQFWQQPFTCFDNKWISFENKQSVAIKANFILENNLTGVVLDDYGTTIIQQLLSITRKTFDDNCFYFEYSILKYFSVRF
ncbi:hypothetical protein B4U79_16586 [Dinothrombium tinctorium]|uniref:GH18 domain-containing protein n=1 Tax=Dinothrombium tinctorium TaxID=1965070 RepID=A0A3S3P115_9ACAR|nr:hypothetical protein B4U79_16586 [Dinothrombium tinctorium]